MKPAFKSSLLVGLGFAGALCANQSAMAADLPSTAAPAPIAPAPLFIFQDNSVSYRLETSATDPGSAVHFVKNVASFTHVDAWAYGTNFFNIDFLASTNADPTAPIVQNAFAPYNFNGSASVEVYAFYRGTLSLNAITHSKTFSLGFLKDVSLKAGVDGNTQDNAFAPQKRDLVGGLQFDFDVPGFLNLSVLAYKEWNHNGLYQVGGPFNGAGTFPGNADYNNVTGETSFQVTPRFEVNYLQPLTFTGLPLAFTENLGVNLPKGIQPGNGLAAGTYSYTRTEIFSLAKLDLDIGKYVFHRANFVDVYVGWKYWLNKFGNNANSNEVSFLPGSYEDQAFVGASLHF